MGKWHLGDELFAQHGFHEWVSMEDGYNQHFTSGKDRQTRSSYHHFLIEHGYKPDSGAGTQFSRGFAVRRKPEHCKPAFLAREASRFLRENAAAPWMLYVNFLEPHMPFFGPYNDLHSSAEAPLPANYPGDAVAGEPERYRASRARYLAKGFEGHDLKSLDGWQRLNRNYAGLCAQVDEAVGRILWTLEATGQADNTILVFTSDHGEMMGSHSLIGKSVMYEEAVRVPLLLRVPFRRQRPMRVAPPVSHISLVPTLLELLGHKPPESLPGQSLLPLLDGSRPETSDVFIEWHTPPDGPAERTVVTPGGWKLVLSDRDKCLLFNRHRDPLELHNLYSVPEFAPVVRDLRSRIAAWQKRVGDNQSIQ
jgi:arylsulfatase A-like enzyme